jgi:hypothetical protein
MLILKICLGSSELAVGISVPDGCKCGASLQEPGKFNLTLVVMPSCWLGCNATAPIAFTALKQTAAEKAGKGPARGRDKSAKHFLDVDEVRATSVLRFCVWLPRTCSDSTRWCNAALCMHARETDACMDGVQVDDEEEEEEDEEDSDGEGWDSDETGTDVTHDEDPSDPDAVPDADDTTATSKSSKANASKKTEGSGKKAQ